jgi:acetyltransferase-like isoleucine patch superfamily enzyme
MNSLIERLIFKAPRGLSSRLRTAVYSGLGMRIGPRNRFESIRVRRPRQIRIGGHNSFTEGCWLWPEDSSVDAIRIQIGNQNFFNRDVMIDACGSIVIGDHNMIGPGVYITDSNHTMDAGPWVSENPMQRGKVVIGNGCWIGARAVILKDVELGDRCVVAAGAVVTKKVEAGAIVAGVPAKPMRSPHG